MTEIITDSHVMTMRRLQDDSNNGEEEPVSPNDGETLRNTMRVYGSLYLAMLILFCFVRKRFKAYNVRNWSDKVKCDLASEQYGFINWMWRLYVLSEDDILDNCGMDALCFLRMLEFGFKVSVMGIFNSIWLMPIYKTAPASEETSYIDDQIVQVSVSNVPATNKRLIATAIGAWIIFGFTMYLILKEFEWFTRKRHQFLSKKMPRNYTVYISGITPEYRSSSALLAFFRESFSYEAVLEARVALDIPRLEKKVAKRDSVVAKLEHAIALEEMKGITPTHIVSITGAKANSIEAYTAELTVLNKEISEEIDSILFNHEPHSFLDDLEDAQSQSIVHQNLRSIRKRKEQEEEQSQAFSAEEVRSSGEQNGLDQGHSQSVLPENLRTIKECPSDNSVTSTLTGGGGELMEYTSAPSELAEQVIAEESSEPHKSGFNRQISKLSNSTKKIGSKIGEVGESTLKMSTKFGSAVGDSTLKMSTKIGSAVGESTVKIGTAVGDSTAKIGSKIGSTAVATANLIFNSEDGKARESGFVTFTKLSTTQAALQMVHNPKPFAMEVAEAPNPDDIFWANVGKTHEQLQSGKLIGFSLTVLLCFFWTIPVAFVTSLSSVEGLKESIPWLKDAIEKFPALEQILAQLAPLLIVALNVGLPHIVIEFAKLEGPVSTSVLEASLFVKLAVFMIIQTFFVSSISGSITQSISAIIDNPESIVDLLANSLPTQAIFYVQILLVSTFLGQGLELLRVLALVIAWIRSLVGPNLTEKERNSMWMWLYPLADPWEFEYAEVLAEGILYFMVTFVYSSLAPVTNYFLAVCYLLLGSGYRNQFIHIYPPTPDSGGKLWTGFIGIVQTCMLIAEITIFGYLGLKKAPVAAGLIVPLIIVTILFNFYIRQEHIRVASHLPTKECHAQDLRNNRYGPMDFDFVKGAYLQPALQVKVAFPDNFGIDREIAHETMNFLTPPHSEAEILDDMDPFDTSHLETSKFSPFETSQPSHSVR